MDWSAPLDGYCERLGPGLWAEPLNLVSNAAFVIAAIWCWHRSEGLGLPRLLSALLFIIGIGSALFHSFATVWAMLADVLPIAVFILAYVYAANRVFWRWPVWLSGLGAAGFVPWALLLTPLFATLPFFEVSAFYWPVPLLIALYAVLLWRRWPMVGRGMALGAGLLCLSLAFRSIDETLCEAMPAGTHFAWHGLNGVMLGWMIELIRRALLAGPPAAR
ncbi:ceramidase [Limimaricola soesokkakensis]|uniref:Ceramidase n=1 Tax=Limimaricola soesokkakensis TaxID=1343159 RepID=A0A1X6Z5V2_9RHOB|nr:ceramidase domain-containing protein [Limimaricola soesokkakensis]PSK86803.1 ceramidase [Limimaricola soesokkakensis]SLN41233.1 hypothetical protein LOS8367_01716 [Limimaricola soesokkakensis]